MASGGFFGPDGVGSVTAPETFCPCQGQWESGFAYLFKHHHSLPEKAGDQVVLRLLVSLLGTCVEQVIVLWMSLPHAKVSNMEHLCV